MQFVKTSGKDPLTDRDISYRCIKLVNTTTWVVIGLEKY